MKRNKVILRVVLMLLVFDGWSQQLIFEVTPGLKFYGTSYQKIKGEVTSGGANTYHFENTRRVGSYENISYTNKFGLEPELNVAFLKLNEWKFGLGISTFIVKSKIRANTKGKSYLSTTDSSTTYTEYISKQLINRYNQFSLFATRTFLTNTRMDKFVLNSLTVGFGINKPSRFNTRNEKEYYASGLYDNYGYEKEVTFRKTSFWGFLTPVVMLRYELEIRNRKNNYGLLKLNFSYVQGFSDHNTFHLRSSSVGGAAMNVEAINRGSGFRIGISKTFRFE